MEGRFILDKSVFLTVVVYVVDRCPTKTSDKLINLCSRPSEGRHHSMSSIERLTALFDITPLLEIG